MFYHIIIKILGDSNPSPNSYTLPTMLGDKVVTRSSSANFIMTSRSKLGGFDCDYAKTPGPARYGVTSADIHKRKSPAYSLLSRRFMPGGMLHTEINFIIKTIHTYIILVLH